MDFFGGATFLSSINLVALKIFEFGEKEADDGLIVIEPKDKAPTN